jgi:hypothetical protein
MKSQTAPAANKTSRPSATAAAVHFHLAGAEGWSAAAIINLYPRFGTALSTDWLSS